MKVLDFLTFILGGIFRSKPVYKPLIPPVVRRNMQKLLITESELLGAFYSKDIKSGYAPNSTVGVANYHRKVVGAVYKKDENDPMQWVIIGCFSYLKKKSDPITGRKYWDIPQNFKK